MTLDYVTFSHVNQHDWINPNREFVHKGWLDVENNLLICNHWYAADNALYCWYADNPEDYDYIELTDSWIKH